MIIYDERNQASAMDLIVSAHKTAAISRFQVEGYRCNSEFHKGKLKSKGLKKCDNRIGKPMRWVECTVE